MCFCLFPLSYKKNSVWCAIQLPKHYIGIHSLYFYITTHANPCLSFLFAFFSHNTKPTLYGGTFVFFKYWYFKACFISPLRSSFMAICERVNQWKFKGNIFHSSEALYTANLQSDSRSEGGRKIASGQRNNNKNNNNKNNNNFSFWGCKILLS